MSDQRPLFTEATASKIQPGLRMVPVIANPSLLLDSDTVDLLRDGLGHFDMEIRWLAQLDQHHLLRLWRSWTGHQIYQAVVDETTGSITDLKVEQDNDRYRGDLADEPEQFTQVLMAVVNTLRYFRAGHTLYGPAEGADPLPSPWSRNEG